jgi:adenosylcobinamide-GDP ribazoletransferase
MFKGEIKIFLTAVMFYTRIPSPKWVDHNQAILEKATRYFPLIGWIVGGMSALSLYGFARILPLPVAVILSMITAILTTGAFHEDGFADVCDGFGGGWTKEKILMIMKDSRLGAYGAIGISLLMLLKFFCLYGLAGANLVQCCLSIFAAHALSRLCAILLRINLEYVRANEESKAKPIAKQTSNRDYLIAALFGLMPMFVFKTVWVAFVFVPLAFTIVYLRWYFKKWIGGYTGDCLGAAQQICEVIFYLSLLILWKFT